MARAVIFLAVAGIATFIVASVMVDQGAGRSVDARLAIAEDTIELRTTEAHCEARFVLENVGEGDLVIEELVPDCDCTTVEVLPSTTIESGKTGILRVVIDTAGLEGTVRKNVTIKSTDAVAPEQIVAIRITKPYVLIPSELVFGRDGAKAQELRIINMGYDVVVVDRWISDADGLKVNPKTDSVPYLRDGSYKDYVVELDETRFPPGRHDVQVHFDCVTDEGIVIQKTVSCQFDGASPLSLEPPAVTFGLIESLGPDRTVERSCRVFRRQGYDMCAIESVVCENAQVVPEVAVDSSAGAWVLTITVQLPVGHGKIATKVRVRTTSPIAEISIPVLAYW